MVSLLIISYQFNTLIVNSGNYLILIRKKKLLNYNRLDNIMLRIVAQDKDSNMGIATPMIFLMLQLKVEYFSDRYVALLRNAYTVQD